MNMLDKPSNSINKCSWFDDAMTKIKRRGVSPLLATVILLGVTVAGGASVFGYYTSTQNILSAAATSDGISVTNVNAIATDKHGSLDFTITNTGDKPWTGVSVTALKGEVPKRIFYMPINFMLSSSATSSPSSAVTASAVTDILPGDGNGGWVGYSNLISYSTPDTPFAPFQVFKGSTFFQPSNLCTANPLEAAGFFESALCGTTTLYHGIKLNDLIYPGQSINPSAFLFTKVPTNIDQTATNQIDTVKTGDKLTLQITVNLKDGKQIVKTFPVTVR
jgi:flagellin-like protein